MKHNKNLFKYRIVIVLMMSLNISIGYCQQNVERPPLKTISGSVINTDAVGNIITVRADGQGVMAFWVPDKAIIKQEANDIGLMDIGIADSVTIQYYVSSSTKNIVASIVENEAVINE